MDIEAFLRSHGIAFQRFEHPAVSTCEESSRLCPPMPGLHTKNLFLRDEKKQRIFLVIVGHGNNVDLKALRKLLGVQKLSFGDAALLRAALGVDPGAVTLLGLVSDPSHTVEVIVDRPVWEAAAIGCHPLRNTATVVIPHEGFEKFLAATGHVARVIDVPLS